MDTLNLNQAECIKRVTQFGYNDFVNICNGSHTFVPWGFGDWCLFGVGVGLGAYVGLVAIGIVYAIWCDY